MSTQGFEFAYMMDGSSATPVIRDFTLGAAAIHKIGDLMAVTSDGTIDQVTSTTTEVTCVMQEATTADITAGTTTAKAAILTRNQVWRCSTNASTAATAFIGIKTWDTADTNTIGAADVSGGKMIVAEGDPTPADISDRLDEEGYVIGYVVFGDTTFGNA